jgi:3-dehydroquinate synthase
MEDLALQKFFKIQSSIEEYEVQFLNGHSLDHLINLPNTILLVDIFFKNAFKHVRTPLIFVEANEQTKSLDFLSSIFADLRNLGASRNTTLIVVGGGVLQDIGTFIASTYMRGIPWEYVPTTMLALADSCIGGKSSINVREFKNLVGNIYPPRKIIIDSLFTKTLNENEITGGLFEAAKITYAHSVDSFARFLSLANSPRQLIPFDDIIELSLLNKKWFIEKDEFDKKERLLLNFGHTFAHALESASEFKLPHGIAVGLGMISAIHFSQHNSLLNSEGMLHVQKLYDYIISNLKYCSDLNLFCKEITQAKIENMFTHDKKHTQDHYRLILPYKNGELFIHSVAKNREQMDTILKSFMFSLNSINV